MSGISISAVEAIFLLSRGWTVLYDTSTRDIRWTSPSGLTGDEFHSESLDWPPQQAVDIELAAMQADN